jgi:hypothetical protein
MDRFEFHSYGHAMEILTGSFPHCWSEICSALDKFSITTDELLAAGGNETAIPKKFDDVLYPLEWREIKITGDLLIKMYPRKSNQRGRFSDKPFDEKTIAGWIDGHNIDFIKNKVAFDLEWNSKDQTFDRDLLAMRTYFDCGLIDVGIIVTRSEELNDVFRALKDKGGEPLIKKYGASTTWLGKLIPRLNSRRNGGCPILAVGIRKPCVVDWKEAK